MKAVLVSLKPYYYYLVGEGIKTIEVRKGMPKAEDWNRDTFFYMSKDEKSFAKIPKEFQEKYRKHFGKVGLQFVCDDIDTVRVFNDILYCVKNSQANKLGQMCLTIEEVKAYLGDNNGYNWHISDLVIYDKPKELGEFYNLKRQPIQRAFQSWGYCYEKEI